MRRRLPWARQHLAYPPSELRRDNAGARLYHQHGRLLSLLGTTQSKRGRHRLPRRLFVDAAARRFQVKKLTLALSSVASSVDGRLTHHTPLAEGLCDLR